jgi:hypothetical protein
MMLPWGGVRCVPVLSRSPRLSPMNHLSILVGTNQRLQAKLVHQSIRGTFEETLESTAAVNPSTRQSLTFGSLIRMPNHGVIGTLTRSCYNMNGRRRNTTPLHAVIGVSHFTPLVFSIKGLCGVEATTAIKRAVSLLSAKWK